MRPLRFFLLFLVFVAACSESDQALEADAGAVSIRDGDAGVLPSVRDCAARGEIVRAGLEKEDSSGAATVELTEIDPVSPKVGTNRWQFGLKRGASGWVGANVRVEAWMPDHNHGSPKAIGVSDLGRGRYRADPVYLHMPGLWEIAIVASEPEGEPVRVTFESCVE